MPGKILRRCDVCKGFHASFVVTAPGQEGKLYVCYSCWKSRFSPQESDSSDSISEKRAGLVESKKAGDVQSQKPEG